MNEYVHVTLVLHRDTESFAREIKVTLVWLEASSGEEKATVICKRDAHSSVRDSCHSQSSPPCHCLGPSLESHWWHVGIQYA